MGIRGLMTYVNRNADFLENYELHGGFLVIDGHSLAAQLYMSSRCNCAFGGDHDVYARAIGDFFDELLKCEIVPLVILDGGMEKKKMKTTYDRMAEKLQSATRYTPATQTHMKFMPMAMTIIFTTVVRQKGVRMARCVFEADAGIAGVSKVLNCPVLSFDSDFYIFGVKYIPINTLEPFVVKNSRGAGYMKRCKLFRIDNLKRSFPGLDATVLPLAAILLGNDYIKSSVFKNFFACLKLSNQTQRLYNESQRKIHTTLRWLKNYNLNDAVAAILSKLPRRRRRNVLEKIELVVNGYLILPSDILVPLGFADIYQKDISNKRSRRPFKFQGNIDTLESRQLWREDQSAMDDNSDLDEKSEEGTMELDADDGENVDEEKLTKNWPDWFVREYGKADYPTYFVDMMSLRLFTIPTQIEDFKYPSAYSISLNIVEVIDGLLVAGRKGVVPGLLYVIRDGTEFTRRRLDSPLLGTRSMRFPPLAKLRDAPMSARKKIIDDVLEVYGKEDLLEEIPPQWRLYVATIVYWMKSSNEPPKNFPYLEAMLFTMLLGVIDRKIGYYRTFPSFNRAHGGALNKIESQRRSLKLEKLTKEKTLTSKSGKPEVGGNSSSKLEKPEVGGNSSSKLEKPEVRGNLSSKLEKPEIGGNSSSKLEQPEVGGKLSSKPEKPEVGGDSSLKLEKPEIGGNLSSKQEKRPQESNFFVELEKPEVGGANSIMEALEAVDVNDCLMAASFFISNYLMDQQLVQCPRKFNVTIVHTFAQFQSCLRHAIHLNSLLGSPYEYPIISDMYNGTMLYNLCKNFKKRNDVKSYIAVVLENAPSLLHVLKLLMWKVKSILDGINVEDRTVGGTTKRRNKKMKKKESVEDDNMVSEIEAEMEVEISQFVDPQNPYTALNVAV